jgi:hypothetical protein
MISTEDEFHSMDELYEFRAALTAILMRDAARNGRLVWRSWHHHPDDAPMYPGYFIVGAVLPTGTITFHYQAKEWDLFEHELIPTLDHSLKWDGHTPAMVLRALRDWARR